ncbi:MAG: 1,4-dihydroxy-2-naphthoate octaprenyltransferase [Peptococcaceae bacterium]|jgi:1,4-dihydroxy-2-naphthoate octaprenyltransferase|nr:1,4-dihydroxy-2-naphthoate octaprenyltransferase [Peptococcaceae bacterium]
MLKTWFISLRPWSFTAAIVPVTLGAFLALNEGFFNVTLFGLSLFASIAIQAGTNLINSYGDFISGVDTEESATTVPFLVKGILKPKQMLGAGILFFALAGTIGLYLVNLRGWPLLLLGILGTIGGYTYTAGPVPYKYKGLGSFLVFFLMGPMMVWGAYFVQTGNHSWTAVWSSLPVAFLVSGILHANDLRDLEFDGKAGIKTLALMLGRRISFSLYYALNIAAFLSLFVLISFGQLPVMSILPLLLLPRVRVIFKDTRESWKGNKEKLTLLEATAAQFHFQFGFLLVTGLLANYFLKGGL